MPETVEIVGLGYVGVSTEEVCLVEAAAPPVNGDKAVVLGVAFKENCADPRNSKVAMGAEELLANVVLTGCIIDVKAALNRDALEARGLRVWRL